MGAHGSAALLAICAWAFASPALGQSPHPEPPLPSWSTLLTVGALALVPVVLLACTSYAKLSVVFSILNQALGTPQVPSATVVAALSAVLTLYIMYPVGAAMAVRAEPSAAELDPAQPWANLPALLRTYRAAEQPLVDFLSRHAGAKEKKLFARMARGSGTKSSPSPEAGLRVLVPAFLVTELAEAFQIGLIVFLPFLVLDLVVANLMMALGIQALDPHRISLPLKLLLFVSVDGWYLLSEALLLHYA